MRPVNDTPFGIPLVFPEKLDRISGAQGRYRRREINVVRHQQCLPRSELQDEALVPATVVVIGEQFDDFTFTPDLKIALSVLERLRQDRIRTGTCGLQLFAQRRIVPCEIRKARNDGNRKNFFHRKRINWRSDTPEAEPTAKAVRRSLGFLDQLDYIQEQCRACRCRDD